MFLLVCSNEEDIHTVKTIYWHHFRLELEAVIKEQQTPGRSKPRLSEGDGVGRGGDGGDGDDDDRASALSTRPVTSRSLSPRRLSSSNIQHRPCTFEGVVNFDATKEAFSLGVEGVGEDIGVRVNHFSKALARCPEMLEVFGKQLEGLRHMYHRPLWMAPIFRNDD